MLVCRSQASALASLIAQMQENADQVEKDILRSEELLALVRTLRLVHQGLRLCQSHHLTIITITSHSHQDNENEKKDLPFQHQEEISDKLGRAEGLLMDLFLDVTKAKKLGHPQASEIENE